MRKSSKKSLKSPSKSGANSFGKSDSASKQNSDGQTYDPSDYYFGGIKSDAPAPVEVWAGEFSDMGRLIAGMPT